jgi:hypothetical protein
MITVYKSVSITPVDLFTVIMFIKVIYLRRLFNFTLKKPFALLGYYFLFSFFIGSVFFSTSLETVVWFLRPAFYTVWFFIFIGFVKDGDNIFNFLKLIFPIVFFCFFAQIFSLVTAEPFINLFDPYAQIEVSKNTLTGELRVFPGGPHLIILIFMGAIFMLKYKEKTMNRLYLSLLAVISFLIVFISATRYLFGMFLVILIFTNIKMKRSLINMSIILLISLLIISALVRFEVFSGEYVRFSAWGRVSQIFNFFGGKPEEIDTVVTRLEDLKEIAENIKGSPLVGYGFSDLTREYYNNNLGFVNTILMFGICGFLLFLFLIISYIKMMTNAIKNLSSDSKIRDSLPVLLVTFSAILLAYSLTMDFFSLFYPYMVMFMMIFFGISEIFIREDSLLEAGNN